MNNTLSYIGRFLVILIGYCCAILAAGCFLAAILYSQMNRLLFTLLPETGQIWADTFTNFADLNNFYVAVMIGGIFFAILASGLSFLPAMALIVFGEIKGARSSLFYSIGGLVIGLLAISTSAVFTASDPDIAPHLGFIYTAFACAGIVGGFIYWLIAGRHAGQLNDRVVNNRPTSE